jgi:hypothetical protein
MKLLLVIAGHLMLFCLITCLNSKCEPNIVLNFSRLFSYSYLPSKSLASGGNK